MRTLPPEPNPGDPVSANLIRNLIRAIRERTIIQGPGVKTSTGPNGTTISAAPGNKGSSYTPTPQCFDLVADETSTVEVDGESIEVTDYSFINRFWVNGMSIVELDSEYEVKVSEGVMKGSFNTGDEYTEQDKPYVVLKVSFGSETSMTIDFYKDIESINEDLARHSDMSLSLLYKLDHFGHPVIDFRNIQRLQHIEMT